MKQRSEKRSRRYRKQTALLFIVNSSLSIGFLCIESEMNLGVFMVSEMISQRRRVFAVLRLTFGGLQVVLLQSGLLLWIRLVVLVPLLLDLFGRQDVLLRIIQIFKL